jgi:hypothetical protein
MAKKITVEKISQIFSLHSQGRRNQEIAAIVGVSRNTVQYHIESNGLQYNGPRKYEFEKIGKDKFRCSKCKEIKPLSESRTRIHSKTKNHYQSSYCVSCRSKQSIEKHYEKNYKDPESFFKYKRLRIKSAAKQRGIEFNLSENHLFDLFEKQNQKCFYSDKPLIVFVGERENQDLGQFISVDRLDNNKGYIDGNVCLCLNRVNSIKSNLTEQELKDFIPDWYDRIKKSPTPEKFYIF